MASNETPSVLRLGDPRLRRVNRTVDVRDPRLPASRETLMTALRTFQRQHGFGRGNAAPQIGFPLRFIACHTSHGALAGHGPVTLVNPRIAARSEETFTLWDDCMSFPDLLVRVRRHRSIDLTYFDEPGRPHEVPGLDPATSELLQHEIDHLDGILALDRALDTEALLWRGVYESNRTHFDALVDGLPAPSEPAGD